MKRIVLIISACLLSLLLLCSCVKEKSRPSDSASEPTVEEKKDNNDYEDPGIDPELAGRDLKDGDEITYAPEKEAVLGAIDAGEWFALFKDRPSLGPLCPYAFAKLTDAQLEELAKPGNPAGVRVPAQQCRFFRTVGRFLVAAFALALAAGAALWLLDYIFTGMTNNTIDNVAIVCAVIVGVTLFGLIIKKMDISGRDVRFIGSVLIMIGWGVWWLTKFVLTTLRDWFN